MLKRNVDQPTLDDRFNKAVLPKVMQVKDFGFAGRTKYTHLKDQDTTQVRRHGSLVMWRDDVVAAAGRAVVSGDANHQQVPSQAWWHEAGFCEAGCQAQA